MSPVDNKGGLVDDTEVTHLRRRIQELDAELAENVSRRSAAEASVSRLQGELEQAKNATRACDACVGLLDVIVADRIIGTLRRLWAEMPLALEELTECRVKGEDGETSLLIVLNEVAGRFADGYGRIGAVYDLLCEKHGPDHEGLEVAKGLKEGSPCPIAGCEGSIKRGRLLGFRRTRAQ